ncbi:MAG: GspE/PulE family protein [Gammaproteobacteria bacterium]|nr:GspE/PulE family protein [Gammaproteobacteria bacterium]
MTKSLRLGELLLQSGVITEKQLKLALNSQKKSGRKLGQELLSGGHLNEDALIEALAKQLNIAKINLNELKLNPNVSRKFPEQLSRHYNCLVYAETDSHFEVVMDDPTDIHAYDELTRILGKRIVTSIGPRKDITHTIKSVYRRGSEIRGLAAELGRDLEANAVKEEKTSVNTGETPVAKFLHTMFEDAIAVNASDIHIEPGAEKFTIRLRQDGVLTEQAVADKKLCAALISRLKLMASLDISEKRLPQDGRFQIRIKNSDIDVRLSTVPAYYGESAVMRLLDQSKDILNLEQTGMTGAILEQVRKLTSAAQGMLLVTGPTGSGKTTTLYGALSEINKPDVKILTVEDPIEYRLPGIIQVQVNPKIGLDFSDVLRTFLRQDPDIILVGEMRDKETVEIGMKAAMTGHLVLSTLHTNDAISTITRLLDMGAQPYLIASSLQGILAQRLLRRICKHCSQDYQPDEKQTELMRSIWGEQIDGLAFKQGSGCVKCQNLGYSGRVAVYEMLMMEPELVRAIQAADIDKFAELARQQKGFKRLQTTALQMAAKGITTVEQVIRLGLS